MFSVIIPTMWKKPQITLALLETLIRDSLVAEIIIIDNSCTHAPAYKHEKVKIITQSENIYVNPSWNLGVSLAKFDKIAILNDDIIIPYNLLYVMNEVPLQDYGLIGIDGKSVQYQIDNLNSWQQEENRLKISNTMNYGFGICIFLHRNNYYPIPDNIKIWYGDNYLYVRNVLAGKQNLVLSTLIKTEMSSTSNMQLFNPIKEEDEKNFLNLVKTGNNQILFQRGQNV